MGYTAALTFVEELLRHATLSVEGLNQELSYVPQA